MKTIKAVFRRLAPVVLLMGAIKGMGSASCGSAACPLDVYTQEQSDRGMVRLDFAYEYIDQDRRKISRRSAGIGEITGHHDEISTLNITRTIGVDIGWSDRLSTQFQLPFIRREHRHVHHHHGTPLLETWDFEGRGDLTVLSRYALTKGGLGGTRWSAVVGGVVPTGRDHVTNDNGDRAEVGILPGKGAYGLILGASALKKIAVPTATGVRSTLPMFLSSTYQWNEPGPHRYRMGNQWLVNAGVTYPVLPRVGVIAQLNLKVLRRDDRGNTRDEIQKTGGEFLFVSPGVQLTLAENLWSFLIVQLPLHQRVNEIQLVSSSNLITGLSYRFSAL